MRPLVLALAVVLFTVGASVAQAPETATVIPNGGAAGGPALYLNNGDVIGVRNIQGGTASDNAGSLNLDIGAGSTANPGDVVLNYDVGRRTLIYDGHKRLVASFGPNGIVFYQQPRVVGDRLWFWRRSRR